MITPATRMKLISTHFFASLAVKISEMTIAGKDVIRLDEGSPDMPPPTQVIQALASSAAKPNNHGYQSHRGTKELREAWASFYYKNFGVRLDPDKEVLPLIGSKEGIFHLAQAFIENNDIVLAPDPGYITYWRGTVFAGGKIVAMPLLPENNYLPEFDRFPVEIIQKAKVIWLNYPNNPTTGVATLDFFSHVVQFCRKHNLLLCHDAAYSQITFDDYHSPSVLQVSGAKEVAIEFNTLSKSHNMAGWRSAVGVGNADVLNLLFQLKTNTDSGHFLPILEASVKALNIDQSWVKERNGVYQARRNIVIQGLYEIGLSASIPKASIYVWSPVPDRWSSLEFATQALDKSGVSMTPGTVFGELGEGFVRISLTAPTERVAEAMERLKDWLVK